MNVFSFGNAISETKSGTIIAIEVTAGAIRDIFPTGYNEWRKTIGCSVTAPATDGKANQAAIAIIAKTLGLPTRAVQIQTGARSHTKRVLIRGKNRSELLAELAYLLQV